MRQISSMLSEGTLRYNYNAANSLKASISSIRFGGVLSEAGYIDVDAVHRKPIDKYTNDTRSYKSPLEPSKKLII